MLRLPYDEKYRIISDSKFFIEALVFNNCTYEAIDIKVTRFYPGGISNTETERVREEWTKAKKEMFPPRLLLDYEGITVEGNRLLRRLSKYRGFRRYMIKLCNLSIDLYGLFSQKLIGNK